MATEGEDRGEAIRNIREAVEGYLEVRAELLGRSRAKKQLVEISVKQRNQARHTNRNNRGRRPR